MQDTHMENNASLSNNDNFEQQEKEKTSMKLRELGHSQPNFSPATFEPERGKPL